MEETLVVLVVLGHIKISTMYVANMLEPLYMLSYLILTMVYKVGIIVVVVVVELLFLFNQ